MVKITFTHPIQIIQDGLKAMALFTYAARVHFIGAVALFDGNAVHQSLIKEIEA